MSPNRAGAKLFVAFAALGGAFLLAQPFRHQGSQTVRHEIPAVERVVLRETAVPGDQEIQPPNAPTAEIQPTLLAPPHDPEAVPDMKEEVARLTPPPTMARTYPGSGADASRHSVQRTHRVRDGDTLESLAQRYYGDRSRWQEIYQANREQIARPDLLPLNVRLRIPPNTPQEATDWSRSSSVAQAPWTP
jgi:nucleoid-associated protein YgaU